MAWRFVFKLVIFSLPLALASLWFEARLRAAPNSRKFKRELIERAGPAAEILIFGTSHAYYDFDPAKFSRPGLNLANTSQSLILDQQLYAHYADLFANVRVLILNLSYFSFEYRLYGNTDDYREFGYIRDYGLEGDGGWRSRFDPRRYSDLLALGPALTRKILFEGHGTSLEKEISPQGWYDSRVKAYPHLPVSEAAGRGRARYHTSTLDPSLAKGNLAAIAKLVEIAKAHGVRVVLSQAPTSIYYSQSLDAEALHRFALYIEELKQTLDLKFYDYLRDPRFGPEDFYDNDHLNAEAAGHFSAIFDREVLTPTLAESGNPAEN